jgi:hypothetical protein
MAQGHIFLSRPPFPRLVEGAGRNTKGLGDDDAKFPCGSSSLSLCYILVTRRLGG